MKQTSALEIKLTDNFFDKEALNFLKNNSTAGIHGIDFLSSFFFKNSEMLTKIEQLETRLQDSEHEVS